MPLARVAELLAFNGPQEAASFCDVHGLPVEERAGEYVVLLDKVRVRGWVLGGGCWRVVCVSIGRMWV